MGAVIQLPRPAQTCSVAGVGYYDSMLSWARRRKFLFIGWAGLFVLLVFGVYALAAFYRAPNCQNGAKDGDEREVDCGGKCPRVCPADAEPLLVHFVRALEVDDKVWGAVASVENRNPAAGARDVPYVFKLYDAENLLLYERRGAAFVPPRKAFALFEGRMSTGSRTPARATLDFLEGPVFERMHEPALLLATKGFSTDERGSLLEAVITNPARTPVVGVEATALLFAPDGNVIGASATFVKKLAGEGSATLSFTWPRALPIPARIEVLYTVPGQSSP